MFSSDFFRRQFSTRKLFVGLCSVAIGLSVTSGQQVYTQEDGSSPDLAGISGTGPVHSEVEKAGLQGVINPTTGLNLVKNPSLDRDDYVAKEQQDIQYRDPANSNSYFYQDGEGKWGARTKEGTTNDFLLFGIDTEPGKSYTATADIYVETKNGHNPSGAFFDVKEFTPDGGQKTISGGKSAADMTDSLNKWGKV